MTSVLCNNDGEDLSRIFWERKADYHINMLEYGRYSPETFIKHMEYLGWDRDDLIELMEEDGFYVDG